MKYKRTAAVFFSLLLFAQGCFFTAAEDWKGSLAMRLQEQEILWENIDYYKLILSGKGTASFRFIGRSVGDLPMKWRICIYNAHREKIADVSSGEENQEYLSIRLSAGTYYIKIVSESEGYHIMVKEAE